MSVNRKQQDEHPRRSQPEVITFPVTQAERSQQIVEMDDEEAMPLRPMTRGQNAPGAITFFGSSEDGQSEVREQSMMNDTGIAELIYGIKHENIGQLQS